jgi:peptidoglycan-associated lipoprotein
MVVRDESSEEQQGRQMTYVTKALLVMAVLATAACNANANRFGGAGGAGGAGAGGIGTTGLGSPSDPNSPAYFNQTIGDRVFFAVDSTTLTPEAQAVLRQQAVWLMNNPSFTAIVEGHADEQGTREYNLGLSERRANAARDFLVTQGVASNRLLVNFYGKDRPVAVCPNESCWSQNRRVVTVLGAGGTS